MKKIALAIAVVTVAGLSGLGTSEAKAQFGLHIGGSRIHVDIGNPHGGYSRGYSRYQNSYQNHNQHYRSNYQVQSYRAPVRWHDTTHLDYHGPAVVRHGNHYDYQPGHYDVHRSGHYDVGGRHRINRYGH